MRRMWELIAGLILVQLVLALGLALHAGATPLANPALPSGEPDLAIEKYRVGSCPTAGPRGSVTAFAPGNEVSYEIYFSNQSSNVAEDVFIEDTLPISTTYVASSGPGFVLIQAGPDQVRWFRDGLTDFESGWLCVTVRVDADAPVGAWASNTAYIFSFNLESNLDNNEYSLTDQILPNQPDMAITKQLYPGSAVGPGQRITYTITYQNRGGVTAHDVRITDTLPISTTYVSNDTGDSLGFTTVVTGDTVVWTKSEVDGFAWGGYGGTNSSTGKLYLTVSVSDTFQSDDWLENRLEISTSDAEYNYDNNVNRYVWKPEPTLYGAAVTSVDAKTMHLLNDGGFDWMLYYLDWSKTEPSDDQYNWHELDDVLWKAKWYNLKLAVRVDRAPAWARPGKGETAPPDDPDKLRDFLDAIADRTHVPPVDAFIIWNEPNLALEWGGDTPDAAAYAALLQAAYQGVNGRALVVSAGLATTNDDSATAIDDRTFLTQTLSAGACGFLDRLGVNPMGFASAPDDTSDPNGYDFSRALEWRQIMVDNGCSKDLFATEMGWLRDTPTDLGSYNWMKVSGVDQAHYLARAYHKARREWLWMGPMMLWNLDFAGFYSDTEHFHWFAVTDENRDPLRSYLTLKNAATRGPADLWVEKELISPVTPGGELLYLIHYTNIGGQPAAGVVLTDTLPSGTAYVTDTLGSASVGAGRVVWNIGTVDTGAREAITLTLQLMGSGVPGGLLTNTVEANTLPGEPYTDDNVAAAVPPLVPEADLSITKASNRDGLVVPTAITYTIAVRNSGPSDANGATVTDHFPTGISNPSWTCTTAGGASCAAGPVADDINETVNLPAGGMITYTVTGTLTTQDTVINTANVAVPTGVADPVPSNNQATDRPGGQIFLPAILEDYSPTPDLVVTSLVATGSAVTVTVGNQGDAPTSEAFWVDVYFNPFMTPTLNQPWDTLAKHGAVWGVTIPILPGGSLVLATGGDYYFAEYSSTPPLPVGANVYALVDSISYYTSYGNVWESDEGNNLFGPVTSTAGVAGGAASLTGQGQPSTSRLPLR